MLSSSWWPAQSLWLGTANFYEPQTALQVIAGIREFMEQKISDVREISGSVRTEKSDSLPERQPI